MPLNKPALQALNQENFPDNTQQLITPELLREFNNEMINSMELTQSMDNYANLGTANIFYGGNQSIAKEYKLFTNGLYWDNNTAGYNNLEIINSITGNIDIAALGGGVRIVSSSLNITNGTFTASLAEGFTYVGNSSGRSVLVATSSFIDTFNSSSLVTTSSFNSYTQSTNIRLANLESTSASVNVSISNLNSTTQSLNTSISNLNQSTASLNTSVTNINTATASLFTSASLALTTASFSGNTLTFTKGNGTTFGVVIPDVSGSTINTGSFVTTSSFNAYTQSNDQRVSSLETNSASVNISISNINTFTQSANISINALNAATSSYATSAITASSLITASVSLNTITFTKGDGTTFPITVNTGSGGGGSTNTGSLLVTGSVSGNVLTFTKGDASTFNLTVETGSGGTINTGSFATTGSNTFRGNQDITTAGNTQLNIISTGGGQANLDFQAPNANFNAYGDFNIINNGQFGGSGSIKILTKANEMILAADGGFRMGVTNGVGNGIDNSGAITINVPSGSQQLQLTGSLLVNGNLTASLQQGYAWVGNSSNISTLVATSSFGSGGTIDTGSFATTGSNTFTGTQTISTGNLVMPNGFSISAPSGDITNLSSAGTIQFITEPPAGPGGTNDIKFINRVSGSSIIFENTQTGAGNRIDLTGGEIRLTAAVASGSNGRITIGSNTTQINAQSTPILAAAITSSALLVNGNLTASLQQGYVWAGGIGGVSTLVATSSFVGGGGGTGATLGANTFTGSQTFADAGGNASTLVSTSGSLMLVAKTFTSASAHLSSSAGTFVNLIFKDNSNTADTIISGSANIFTNPSAVTAGFKRYMTSNNIFTAVGAVPQISQSMGFSPTVSGNVGAGTITMRGPVSSSTYTINNNINNGAINIGFSAALPADKLISGIDVRGNVIGSSGQIIVIANQTHLTGSSSNVQNNILLANGILELSSSAITFNSNYVGNTTTIKNAFFSSSVGLGIVQVTNNQFLGGTTVVLAGSQSVGTTNAVQFIGNTVGGFTNILYPNTQTPQVSGSNAYHSLARTFIFGQELVITGSSFVTDTKTLGSAFIGRFGVDDGIRNRTSDTVFSVGTGTSGSANTRKTGLRIDSGSNSYFEGSLNVSGSTVFTGSVKVASTFQLNLPTGSNQQAGTAVLDGGIPSQVVVSNSIVTANSIIMLTKQSNAEIASVSISSKGSGTFTIVSSGVSDTDTVGWFIINNS